MSFIRILGIPEMKSTVLNRLNGKISAKSAYIQKLMPKEPKIRLKDHTETTKHVRSVIFPPIRRKYARTVHDP